MSKSKNLQTTAQLYYVDHFKDPEEIAVLLDIAPRTIRGWVKDKGWKALRDAKLNSTRTQIENIKKVIANLTEQTLSIQEQRTEAIMVQDKELIAALDYAAVGIADQVSKWGKMLEALDKSGRISIEVYLTVMDSIFKSMQAHDNKMYLSTIDFQQQHIEHISNTYQ